MNKLLICIVTLFAFNAAIGQQFERNYDIPVSINGQDLDNPWAGGLNSCQVSRIDVNLDGKKDIFIFDRMGSRISVYLNMDDTPGVIDYKYTLEYNDRFPSNMRNWVLLRDMNCDGLEDICTNSGSGFRIYWNVSNTELTFDASMNTNVQAFYDFGSSSFNSGVYCIAPDLPAFNDYDGDGDIDIWSWNEFSTSEYFYLNTSVENGNCETPQFICKNRCYGQFGESAESFSIFYGNAFVCDFNVVDPREAQEAPMRHTGGTTLAVDLDQNGFRDLVIGDVTENTLAAIMMEESSSLQDSAFVVHYDFPATFANTQPAVMTTFLAAFYEDVNNDGIHDLLISPNSITDAADRRSLFLYLNNGQNDLPAFQLIQDNFLQEGMIDTGNGSFPVVFDFDNDGLKDLFVANRKTFELGVPYTSRIAYYRNTGTANAPAFTLVDANWMDIPAFQWLSVYPSFGDLDGDGDADMLIGDQDGLLHYFQNTAAIGQPCQFVLTNDEVLNAAGGTLDVGQNATPQLVDVNGDNKNDLIIGTLNGNVNYYENIGTAAVYSFSLVEDTIGDVTATSILGIQGKSVPYLFKNAQNNWELLIGSETGQINHYTNIENNFLGEFDLVTLDFENVFEGERCSIFLSDITNDNLLDLFVGNIGGGVGVYTHVPIGVDEESISSQIQIFPNPARDKFRIVLPEESPLPVNLRLLDESGRLVEAVILRSLVSDLSTEKMSNGIYHLQLQTNMWIKNEKLIVRK
jgi:hypothetical protein